MGRMTALMSGGTLLCIAASVALVARHTGHTGSSGSGAERSNEPIGLRGSQQAPAPFVVRREPEGAVKPGAAQLPRLDLDPRVARSTGRQIRVKGGANLQAAIDRAEPGDVLLLEPGATWIGPFHLRRKTGTGWITIRSAVADSQLPPEGTRISPAYAGRLPKLVTAGANQSVVYTDAGATNWRLTALEIAAQPNVRTLTALVRIGDGSEGDSTLVAANYILDRLYVHGDATLDIQRCIALNAGATAIIDSYIDECSSKNDDAQAIGGWNGPGPYRIENNYLVGTGENVLFSGVDPKIPNLIPSDIQILRNYIFKPIAWKGTGRIIKNSLELKNAQRVLIEGNVIDGSWAEGQSGAAFNLKSANQNGAAPWSITRDVTVRYNRIRNVGSTLRDHRLGTGPTSPHSVERHASPSMTTSSTGSTWTATVGARIPARYERFVRRDD